ncbi:hypothetical protein [sulfur-oxidizing endosymbiont of Gigantopelta aegis]|uniref:hypothetical protein n=1 Tax=sulfur-oxidizing endosymbiont of Gigantopelta aegis TaxID=2794934 RepID=UPI0018DD6DF0|nr:hypothetical protein [sulfur-oxidizing endosymbiont of Gigantopelta aegis]
MQLFYSHSLKQVKKNKVIVYYNFIFFFFLALNAILLGLKYKLLSYFSDAVSFELIKNLGGGSILDALLYIIDEAVLILVVILAITGLYWLGYKLISNIKYLNELIPPERNIKKYPLTSKIIYFTSFFFYTRSKPLAFKSTKRHKIWT